MDSLRLLAVLTVLGVALSSTPVFAAAYQIDARTEAQAYEIRSYRGTDPENPVLLPRRRIVQYLGLNAYELITGADLGFESNLRVFEDFGLSGSEASRLDGVRTRDADLLYANLRYRGHGLDVQLGRQIYGDVMDVIAFDGLRLRWVSALGIGAEAYGGLWVRGSGFLASSVYQPDGVRESDIRRIRENPDPSTRPAALVIQDQLDQVSPVFGARLLGENVLSSGVSGSVGFRQSLVGSATDYQRLGIDARYGKGRGINGWGGLEYDLIQGQLSQARLSLRYDAALYAVSVELMRLNPTFSASSIWYYFAFSPRHEARVRGDLLVVGPLRYYAQVLYSVYDAPINAGLGLYGVDKGGGSNGGGSVGAAYSREALHSALDVTYRGGYGGNQLWVDLTGGYSGDEGRWSLDARLSMANVHDQYNPLLRGTFWGGQLWGSYALSRATRFSVAVEENVNPFTQSDTKVFFLFDVKAVL